MDGQGRLLKTPLGAPGVKNEERQGTRARNCNVHPPIKYALFDPCIEYFPTAKKECFRGENYYLPFFSFCA